MLKTIFTLMLLGTATAPSMEPNSGDVQLGSTLNMSVTATQPGGGCVTGYTWNATYGGCARPVLEEQHESVACPHGYTGQQTRLLSRYNYYMQSGAVNYGFWSASSWNTNSCSEVIGDAYHVAFPQRLAESVHIDYTSTQAVGLYNAYVGHLFFHVPSRQFWCAQRHWQLDSTWSNLGDLQDFAKNLPSSTLTCEISGNGTSATINGFYDVPMTYSSTAVSSCVYRIAGTNYYWGYKDFGNGLPPPQRSGDIAVCN